MSTIFWTVVASTVNVRWKLAQNFPSRCEMPMKLAHFRMLFGNFYFIIFCSTFPCCVPISMGHGARCTMSKKIKKNMLPILSIGIGIRLSNFWFVDKHRSMKIDIMPYSIKRSQHVIVHINVNPWFTKFIATAKLFIILVHDFYLVAMKFV